MKLALLMVLTPLLGCAHKVQPKLPSMEIPPQCITLAVVEQCDTRFNPPKCKGPAKIDYKPASCPIIHVP
jgi:hypothetical protein